MRKIEPIRIINLSPVRVLSVMNLRKRSKRDKTSFNILNTFSQQTHNKLEFFCLSYQMLFAVLFRCGGKADGQGFVAVHCKLCLGCVHMVVEVMMMMMMMMMERQHICNKQQTVHCMQRVIMLLKKITWLLSLTEGISADPTRLISCEDKPEDDHSVQPCFSIHEETTLNSKFFISKLGNYV